MFGRKANLPRNYRVVHSGIEPVELWTLYRDVDRFYNPKYTDEINDEYEEVLLESMAVVGVRHHRCQLVGVGFLNGSVEQAALCDLAVHPEHRHKGLGRTIVNERVEIARHVFFAKVMASTSLFGDR